MVHLIKGVFVAERRGVGYDIGAFVESHRRMQVLTVIFIGPDLVVNNTRAVRLLNAKPDSRKQHDNQNGNGLL